MRAVDDPRLVRMQGEAESALGELQRARREQGKAQAEAAAAMQDAREALARESDIQGQLQKADQVRGALTPQTRCAARRTSAVSWLQISALPPGHLPGASAWRMLGLRSATDEAEPDGMPGWLIVLSCTRKHVSF